MSVSFNVAEGALKTMAEGARKMVEFMAVGAASSNDKAVALKTIDSYEETMRLVLQLGDSN